MTIGNRNYLSFFGYSFFKVATGSMAPSINENDIILVKEKASYNVGDIITYKENDAYITHRVISIGVDYVITKGDANNTSDDPINKDAILGLVIKDYKNLETWHQVLTNPQILISLFITLVLFDLAFSYKGKKDDLKVLPITKEVSKKEEQEILELTQNIPLTAVNNQLAKENKLTKQELNKLQKKLDAANNRVENLNLEDKEKEFLDYTMRLDLEELQEQISAKINK